MRYARLKRMLDVVGAAAAMALFAAPMLAIASIVRWHLGSPVLFRQRRPGLHGVPFTLLKFRTMRDAHDRDNRALPDSERLTDLGRFLRSTSLDELPELVNVIKGDMSLVGPRPLLMQYLPRYSARQARRHDVKPGITGWAQVHGRNALSWETKFDLDLWYVEHQSFGVDLQILLLTFWKALTREGISQPGHATAEEFRGS
jgi:lipopolysaccharide/colanic/teichoic acid biosynthesis glycosyltransferase